MFSYANTPSGIVIMQSPDPQHIYTIGHAYQGSYIATPTAMYTVPYTITTTRPMQQQPILSQPAQLFQQHHHQQQHQMMPQSAAARLMDCNTVKPQPSIAYNRVSRNASVHTSPIRRTRSGHVSKTRVVKRADLTKICPSCTKQWRLCNCSNVKNRPAPKPYCKFVPPRMANKQNGVNM